MIHYTKQQQEILEIVDRFGITCRSQIERYTGIKGNTVHTNLWRFEKLGLVSSLGDTRPKLFAITKAGSELAGIISKSAIVRGIPNYAILRHIILTTDLILYFVENFRKQGTPFEIETEREIVADLKFQQGEKNYKRPKELLPDFIAISPHEKLAVEVELSKKTSHRIEAKLERYKAEIAAGKYTGVYYFSDKQLILDNVAAYAQYLKVPRINFLNLDQALGKNRTI